MGIVESLCRKKCPAQRQAQKQTVFCRTEKIGHDDDDVNSNNSDKNIKNDGDRSEKSQNNGLDDNEEKDCGEVVVRALFDYQAIHDVDLSFKKGEKMAVIEPREGDWWVAIKSDGSTGYIPSNYVVIDDHNVETQDWWFDTNRREAAKLLTLPTNKIGTFLVRRAADNRSYALSVLFEKMPKVTPSTSASSSTTTLYYDYIKHYRIKKHESGSLYISKHVMFPSLIELIDYYKSNQGGLVCLLRSACPRELLNVPLKDLEVQQNHIQLIDHLGSGQFGDVYRALINGKQEVAVKTLKTESTIEVGKFRKEAEIMHNLRHPRLVQLLGICMQSRPFYIITEFMCGGSLTSYLHDNRATLHFNHLVDIAAQVADGMSYLESQSPPYIHRDLRAANVLVAENNVVKVADFGLAKQVEEGIYEGGEDSKFPVKWTAPEGLRFMMFTVKSDVWSYGVLLYEIFSLGKIPYTGWSNFEVKTQVLQGYRLSQPSSKNGPLDEQVYEMMLKCWDEVDADRPSFAHLLLFFDEIILESNYFVSDLD